MRSAKSKKHSNRSSKNRKRRSANPKTARLIAYSRRFGIIAALVVFVLWLGAWVWLSGVVQRTAHAGVEAFYQASANYGFSVNDILVKGRGNTDPDVLTALINMERGDPILSFDPQETQKMIERISWVKEAQVTRQLPDTIFVNLIERQPLALWQHEGEIRLIDSEGITITAADDLTSFFDLILVVGEKAPDHAPAFLRLLAAEPLIKKEVEAASWVGDRRWDLRLKNGIIVKLPEDDLGLALSHLARMQKEEGLLNKDLTLIDVRTPARITVRTRPGAVKHYQASLRSDI